MLQLIRQGRPSARKVARANTLLLADEGRIDSEVAEALQIGTATVGRIRKRFVEEGLETALVERSRPGQRPKLTCKEEAHLIAVACSDTPQGHGRWTLRRLADKALELGLADSINREAVRQILKKQTSSPGRGAQPGPGQGQLALYCTGCPKEADPSLSINIKLTEH